MNFPAPAPVRSSGSAFTLLELMVVIGIIAVVLVLLVPSITSLSKSAGRKGAISNLTSMIEQTRSLALSDSRTAYLVFVGALPSASGAVVEEYAYRAYAVFEDGAPGTPKVQITKWQKLPTGVSFRSQPEPASPNGSAAGTSVTAVTNSGTAQFPFTPLGPTATIDAPYLAFDSTGSVAEPATASPMRVVIFEGLVNNTTEQPTARDANSEPVRDEVQIGRYNGRAKVVVR